MKKLVMISAAMVLSLSACGGDGLSKEDQKVADNIAAFFSRSPNGATKKQATCFSEKFVRAAGVERLEKAKLVDAKGTVTKGDPTFDDKLANQFADAYYSCVDYADSQAKSVSKGESVTSVAKLADCIRKEIPEAEARKLMISVLKQKVDKTLAYSHVEKQSACVRKVSK